MTAGQEPALRWWNPADAKPTRTQGGHGGEIEELVFSRDGKLLASASADKTARLWDGATGAPKATLSGSGDVVYAYDYDLGKVYWSQKLSTAASGQAAPTSEYMKACVPSCSSRCRR